VGFIDPSVHETMPGWPLRNLLTLLSIRFKVHQIRILCWKSEVDSGLSDKSVVVDLKLANDRATEDRVSFNGGE
jgi:ubiquitin-like modifier-activating enzyme ATG7